MLAPVSYKNDLVRLFGRTVNHRPVDWDTLKTIRKSTRTLWTDNYPEEPFNPDPNDVEDVHFNSSFDYDIEKAVQRQRLFFYQVSLPHFRNLVFLKGASIRYKMYLYLKKLRPDVFLVPCYDMDVFWHAHQAHPVEYQNETYEILGDILPHDDSVNDRNPGSKLCNSEEITRSLWKDTYGQSFSR